MHQPTHDFEAFTLGYAEAVLTKAPDRLAALYDTEVRVFDAWAQWSYDSLAAWRPSLDQWLGSLGEETVHVRFDDVQAQSIGDMGALTAIVTYAAMDAAGQELRSLQDRLSWVLVRRDERWVITHQHTSFPVGGDLKAMLRRP